MPSRTTRPVRAEQGFTLVEVIVVLAVVLLLTGIAVPMISGYMEDGRRARAEAEVKVISGAITSFYKDLGCYPSRNASGSNNTLSVMVTGPALPNSNPWATTHQFATWALSSTTGDTLDNHLLNNMPTGANSAAYPTTGSTRWRGPYLGASPLDPWGRPYLVTVISGWSTSTTQYKRIYVMSAGPNGAIDTSANAGPIDDLANDDVGIVIAQRQ